MRNASLSAAAALAGSYSLAQAGQVSPERRLVWAHAMITFPLDLDVLKPWIPEGYEGQYVSYPLDVRRNYVSGLAHRADVQSGKNAGLDGFPVDIFSDGTAADGYLAAADALGDFHIAACIDGGTDEQIVKAVTVYCDRAAKHPSAAKIGDSFVIFTYGTAEAGSPERWKRLRAEILAKGYKTWWMPDLGNDPSKIQSNLPFFESGYTFVTPPQGLKSIADVYAKNSKPFGGGMMPGYYRFAGGFTDAKGTRTYRDLWKQHLAVQPAWVQISTWNDLAETTGIMPTSDFNLTRAEITTWFAARFRQEPPPWKEPRLYITTPKTVYPGQESPVEALLLNPLSRPVEVSVQLYDSNGNPFASPGKNIVGSGEEGEAVIQLKDAFPPGRFFRARATIRDGKENLEVESPPIVILDRNAQSGFVPLYYSVPAHRSLPRKVDVSLTGSPAKVSIVAPPDIRAEFSEILFNNEILRNFLSQRPVPIEVPHLRTKAIRSPDGATAYPKGEIKGGTPWGFYLARITDGGYRVSYSDPVFVDPPGDLKLKERYSFDEESGEVSKDSSSFQRAGELQKVNRIRPGFGGGGGALSFNGENCRLNLVLGQTPPGPVSIKMAVRPRAYGGMFFCDAGGLWMKTTPEGAVQFVRLGPKGPVTQTSESRIPLNQWSSLEFVWDADTMKTFINGQSHGETSCEPKFASWRRALGCNPFGGGSAYYEGDIDDFEIRSLR